MGEVEPFATESSWEAISPGNRGEQDGVSPSGIIAMLRCLKQRWDVWADAVIVE